MHVAVNRTKNATSIRLKMPITKVIMQECKGDTSNETFTLVMGLNDTVVGWEYGKYLFGVVCSKRTGHIIIIMVFILATLQCKLNYTKKHRIGVYLNT